MSRKFRAPEGRARASPQKEWIVWVAHLARGPDHRRMMSTSDRQRLAWRFPLEGFHPTRRSSGLTEPPPWTGAAAQASGVGSGTVCIPVTRLHGRDRSGKTPERATHDGGENRHRPGPLSDPGARQAGTRIRGRSGGWLNLLTRKGEQSSPAEPRWSPPPPGSRHTLWQIPRGLPPTWLEAFAIHPAAGAPAVWHGRGGCGQNRGGFYTANPDGSSA